MTAQLLTSAVEAVHSSTAISALANEKIRMQAHRYQRGSLSLLKRKSQPDVWVFRYYSDEGGRRTYRKKIVGTVIDFPKRKDVEKAVSQLRIVVNEGAAFAPINLEQLVTHYQEVELPLKSHSTAEGYRHYLKIACCAGVGRKNALGDQSCRGGELASKPKEDQRPTCQSRNTDQDSQSDVRVVLACHSL
jgi:hypothetical protein